MSREFLTQNFCACGRRMSVHVPIAQRVCDLSNVAENSTKKGNLFFPRNEYNCDLFFALKKKVELCAISLRFSTFTNIKYICTNDEYKH